jgi:hypothetical protein
MKFELVDLDEPVAPAVQPVRRSAPLEDDDPVEGIDAAAERLAAHARAGEERVDASSARLAALLARQKSGGSAARAVAPPGNFRADRFTGKERKR